jgi:hypothetical protein
VIAQVKREVIKLKTERNILKKPSRIGSACGQRSGRTLSWPWEGAAVGFLVADDLVKKTWSMGRCGLENGDVFGRSRLGN